jgi:hypothetical protein
MDTKKMAESKQFASKLYQAVLSLKTSQLSAAPKAHRMAQALALAEVMATASQVNKPS